MLEKGEGKKSGIVYLVTNLLSSPLLKHELLNNRDADGLVQGYLWIPKHLGEAWSTVGAQ